MDFVHTHAPCLTASGPLARQASSAAEFGELDNWTVLLDALISRLRSTARVAAMDASAENAYRLQYVVLECVADLDLMHGEFRAESARQRRLQTDIVQAIAHVGDSVRPSCRGRKKTVAGPTTFLKTVG
ncbi:hypothetical protein J2W25_001876 [Variovorax boronicumulans]|uniref:Uncharacterized protein n=1 Tax=Variovorax boronicumulans TaxID=436515 RepID=A0AAW8DTI9_9BURK|nr:hypothetical protein [Variovorax boronicumulans]MDP9877570.1 hypothetical protein [Variovorax boronicumulans]MDP9922855.1 hypothetical protein [Variovorax boronicumulans]